MRILTIIITLLLGLDICALNANAANIVYPKSDNVVINSPETFFIGNEHLTKSLKINGEEVEIHPSGGFWHVVKLNPGVNVFKLDNGKEFTTYKITRYIPSNCLKKDVTTLYETPFWVKTESDNVPLRSMPNDAGLNRLQHFQKGIPLKIIGEYADFYKVQLARDDFAWIAKKHVQKADVPDSAKILSYNYSEDASKRHFELKLSKKVPYILSETNGFDLVVYDVLDFPYEKYEFHINKTDKNFGYNTYYTDDNRLIIDIFNAPKTLMNLRVTIDPGHGGREYGAIGCLGQKEKDVNLDIAFKLKNKLEAAGAKVFMTRTEDKEIGLYDRVEFANKNNSQVFISIHNNALPDSAAHLKSSGTEVYYFYPQSRALAKAVLKALICETCLKDNGAKAQSFAVVRNTNCPAILVEVGYIINPDDNVKLINPEFQDKAAEGILKGLENYLNDIQ